MQEEKHVLQDSNKPISDGVDIDADEGARLRRALGLTVTMKPKSSTTFLPEPYAESYLNGDPEADDSLTILAKRTFEKLSPKSTTEKWTPTPIQLQSWPILKSGSSKTTSVDTNHLNLIAIAATGSGKTLSYALPMIDSCAMVRGKKSYRYVHGLVIVPTRELALQVSKVLKVITKLANKLNKSTDKIVALAIYGGVNREEQIDLLNKKSQYIVAATPLRLIDLLGIGDKDGNQKKDDSHEGIQRLFKSTRYLVIDEADQMATKSDMSQQVDLILNFLREKGTQLDRQCMFSATLPRRAIEKCNEWIDEPRVTVKVDYLTVDETKAKDTTRNDSTSGIKGNKITDPTRPSDLSRIPSHITQTLHVCSNHKKSKKLMTTINKIRKEEKGENKRRKGLLIIFFGRIKTLQYVHDLLRKEEISGVTLHSQMNQQKRESQLDTFRSGKCPILLATDVAARGIHINNVEHVINYDFPGSLEQYVHRCGRAGRNKVTRRTGDDTNEQTSKAIVYSFFNRELAPMANDMVELLRSCNAWVDPNLVALVPGGIKHFDGESKRKRRKRDKSEKEGSGTIDKNTQIVKKMKKPHVDNEGVEDLEDEFPNLNPNRIVLKRASHIAYSDSEDDDAF